MSKNGNATHSHKTLGAVLLLESSAELAKVLVVDRDDEIWVKRSDLSEGAQAMLKEHGRESSARDRLNNLANSNHRGVRR
jgi:hypothetical protein